MGVLKVCKYGCKDPVKCPWPHRDCSHCKAARKGTDWVESPEAALDASWTKQHR